MACNSSRSWLKASCIGKSLKSAAAEFIISASLSHNRARWWKICTRSSWMAFILMWFSLDFTRRTTMKQALHRRSWIIRIMKAIIIWTAANTVILMRICAMGLFLVRISICRARISELAPMVTKLQASAAKHRPPVRSWSTCSDTQTEQNAKNRINHSIKSRNSGDQNKRPAATSRSRAIWA